MAKPSVAHVNITKVNGTNTDKTVDLLAAEEPLEIRLGFGPHDERLQKSISVTMRTPGNDFELALGFLFTEGIIKSADQVLKIQYCTEVNTIENLENIVRVELHPDVEIDFNQLQRNFYTSSSCGVCGKESIESVKTVCRFTAPRNSFTVASSLILQLPQLLREQQSVFEHTGGIHAAALFDHTGQLINLREDVGRHNALDKLIGACVGNKTVPLHQHVLLLSGRASFELIQKAAMAGIQVVCAVGAPSSLAVALSQEFDITLVGFLRDNRFNIYNRPDRIEV
ncbi:MAG: formate dehydrogenase accessory sulfurtransferase FdhD [Bacteroidia bacterium]